MAGAAIRLGPDALSREELLQPRSRHAQALGSLACIVAFSSGAGHYPAAS